eukprot:m.106199 g.106199  ORF g.106199 m.106199 type:complete len:108 (-) comp15762_c0_seq2:268-591(-)
MLLTVMASLACRAVGVGLQFSDEFCDEQYQRLYHNAQSHFHGFVDIVVTFHLSPGGRLSGFLAQPLPKSGLPRGVTLQQTNMPVFPPRGCRYFTGKTASVPVLTLEK